MLEHCTSRAAAWNRPERVTSGAARSRSSRVSSRRRRNSSVAAASPDLPPLGCITDAICRQRVTSGVSYLLPVDKTSNSVDSVYRTNLRMMFKTPYASEDVTHFDESRLQRSAKFHFRTNTPGGEFHDTVAVATGVGVASTALNMESGRVCTQYVRCASKHSMRRAQALQRRLALYPPNSHRTTTAETRQIVKSLFEKDFSGERPADVTVDRKWPHAQVVRHRAKKTGEFEDYDSLKRTDLNSARLLPETQRSPFLSVHENDFIWKWLHSNEQTTEFDRFVDVCS